MGRIEVTPTLKVIPLHVNRAGHFMAHSSPMHYRRAIHYGETHFVQRTDKGLPQDPPIGSSGLRIFSNRIGHSVVA